MPLVYGVTCVALDCGFLFHSSLSFYENRSPAFLVQPQLLPHLIGGNWLLVCALTVSVTLVKTLAPEVKWPLIGLGASTALLMLGDTLVPATKILLSHHAGYFVHTTVAILLTFLAASLTSDRHNPPWTIRGVIALLSFAILVNAVLMVRGTYLGYLELNREVVELSHLQSTWEPSKGDLVVARSKGVDDACGWMPLMSAPPVLFCTDAEVMLAPLQNREVHRFRQALYLYFIRENSSSLQRELSIPDPSSLMYGLGYWAEAVSHSADERKQGLNQIQTDLIPLLEKVEKHDIAVTSFLHNFTRIVVIDKQQDHTFAADRLTSFLKLEGQKETENFLVLFYKPK
jgi:hypothetical protein